VPPLTFGEGASAVRVHGRLDRVDAGPGRLVVLDYKSGRDRARYRALLQEEAVAATNFQLPVYLAAAARALPGRARLEATYLLLTSAERLDPFATEAGAALLASDPAALAAAREAGERTLADAVVEAVERVRAGELPAAPRDCTGCAWGAVCRAEAVAEVEG
jgi:hypothetical protein